MIKNITLVLFKKWKRFNKMQHSRRSALLGIYPKKNSTTKNQVLRLFSRDSHIENFVIFSKFLKINLHAVCLIRLPNQNVTIKAEIVKNFFFPVNNIRMDNQIDKKICNCDNISTFKTFKEVCQTCSEQYLCLQASPTGVKLLTRQGLSSVILASTKLTLKNTVISPIFLVWTFCRKSQFRHSFGRFGRFVVQI